ncbi:MAG: hypothetical protein KBA53_03450 [Thermoclostridium sp.]|nr:hypothetical protein [Thermoclostridium sp.]
MKRFVMIITSMLIIFVFIALNYLLWDRESLVAQGESNQANIDTLTRMNMTLNQEKNSLDLQATELKKQIENLEEKIKGLEGEITLQKRVTDEKVKMVMNMKDHIDRVPVETITLEWVNNIIEKKYSEAYLKSGASCSFWGNFWSVGSLTEYFDQNTERIQLVRNGESKPVIEVIPINTPDWEMSVYIRVDVALKEGAEQDYLKPGENVLHMTCNYVQRSDQWTITSVSSEKANVLDADEAGGN